MENENKYIFISHSHADLSKVRLVRNTFEDRGYEPILFYLHSLSDENEITDLIKREIDARLWFWTVRFPERKEKPLGAKRT